MPFSPIAQVNVSDAVLEQIGQLLRSGELASGDRLPGEVTLAQRLGVGRTSVREALKALEVMGVVTRTRQGTFVSDLTKLQVAPWVMKQASVEELYETRRVLEASLAAMAAQRITDEELAELETLVTQLEEIGETDPDKFFELDMELHTRIAEAAKNYLLLQFFTLVRNELASQHQDILLTPNIIEQTVHNHRQLIAVLQSGDADRAGQLIREALQQVEHDYIHDIRRRYGENG